MSLGTETGIINSIEACAGENFLGLFDMLFEGVKEEDNVFMASLMLVLVVLLGFGLQCACHAVLGVCVVRWILLLSRSLRCQNWRAQMVWMWSKVRSLSSSRSSRIWSYAASPEPREVEHGAVVAEQLLEALLRVLTVCL